ncbi:hypothetical protein PMAYCL1PPCAC_27386, partial [Pristionchus mayeri]
LHAIITRAFCFANCSAVTCPIPLVAPVTMYVLPVRSSARSYLLRYSLLRYHPCTVMYAAAPIINGVKGLLYASLRARAPRRAAAISTLFRMNIAINSALLDTKQYLLISCGKHLNADHTILGKVYLNLRRQNR